MKLTIGISVLVFLVILRSGLKFMDRRKKISTGKEIASFFGLEFIEGKTISPDFYFKASGTISGYKVEVFTQKTSPVEAATYVILYFNKLNQKVADHILLDVQDGSLLAHNSQIHIITGGLRLKIFDPNKDPQFYKDAISFLVSTCKKRNLNI